MRTLINAWASRFGSYLASTPAPVPSLLGMGISCSNESFELLLDPVRHDQSIMNVRVYVSSRTLLTVRQACRE